MFGGWLGEARAAGGAGKTSTAEPLGTDGAATFAFAFAVTVAFALALDLATAVLDALKSVILRRVCAFRKASFNSPNSF